MNSTPLRRGTYKPLLRAVLVSPIWLAGLLTHCWGQQLNSCDAIPATGPVIYDNSDARKYRGTAFYCTNELGNEISFAPMSRDQSRTLGGVQIPYASSPFTNRVVEPSRYFRLISGFGY